MKKTYLCDQPRPTQGLSGPSTPEPRKSPKRVRRESPEDGPPESRKSLGVQTSSLFVCKELGPFQALLGNFQAILGNLLGPFSGDFRQFQAIWTILGLAPKPKKKPALINKQKAGDCTPKKVLPGVSKESEKSPKPDFRTLSRRGAQRPLSRLLGSCPGVLFPDSLKTLPGSGPEGPGRPCVGRGRSQTYPKLQL